jgi:hypothetical protein
MSKKIKYLLLKPSCMASASEILIFGGVLYLFLGTLSGWWLYWDMKRNKGVGQRYIWGTHRGALWFGFMALGLAFVMEKLSFSGSLSSILAWSLNAGFLLVLAGQVILGVRRNPNQITNPDPLPQSIIGIGDILIMAATGILLYGVVTAFWF